MLEHIIIFRKNVFIFHICLFFGIKFCLVVTVIKRFFEIKIIFGQKEKLIKTKKYLNIYNIYFSIK